MAPWWESQEKILCIEGSGVSFFSNIHDYFVYDKIKPDSLKLEV